MTIRTACIVATIGLALGLAAPRLYSAGRELLAPPTAPVIATISMDKVFKGLEEREAMEKDFNETKKKLEEELQSELNKINAEKEKLKFLSTDADRDAKVEELANMGGALKIKQEIFNNRIERKQAQMYSTLYSKITDSCAKLAKQRGFTMIMASDDGQIIPKEARAQDAERFIALKRLFYVAPEHDVSEDLVAMMNNQFKTSGK